MYRRTKSVDWCRYCISGVVDTAGNSCGFHIYLSPFLRCARNPRHCEGACTRGNPSPLPPRAARCFASQENGFPRQCAHWLGMTEKIDVPCNHFTNCAVRICTKQKIVPANRSFTVSKPDAGCERLTINFTGDILLLYDYNM